jgi:hypothetical protein
MTIVGAGLALAIPAVTRSVTSTVPPEDIGTASGAFTTMRQLGGAFGVAVLGLVLLLAPPGRGIPHRRTRQSG